MPFSTFLNGRAYTSLRGLQWLALSDTGSVLIRTYTSDSGGGATQVWAAGSAVPCMIESITSHAQSGLIGGRIDERSTHTVTVPVGTSVDNANRFQITGRGTFEITAVHQQTAEWARTFEVVAVD